MIDFYSENVGVSDAQGFYELQRTSPVWQNLFGVLKQFCVFSKIILDVGCGPYELIDVRNNEDAVGTDVSKKALQRLKRFGFHGIVVQADCLHLPFKDASFDVVFSNQVIEHMLSREMAKAFVKELERLSHRVMIVTPNSAYSRKIHDPTHFFFYTTRSLKQIMPSFDIYCTIPPLNNTLAYYLQFNSPRLENFPIIGKLTIQVLKKIDSSRIFSWANKKLWPGLQLVAIKV